MLNTGKQLTSMYNSWLNELRDTAPTLLGEAYSNPYFSSIPDDWFDTDKPRILVVGEEGFGTWGCGKGDNSISADEIERIQKLNFNYLQKQLNPTCASDINKSPYWRRFREMAMHGICAWTNIDKIHVLDEKRCTLSETDRKLLHSTNTKILAEEIALLNPTHIVFFGWHGTSLCYELPELYSKLYPNGAKDKSVWDKTVVHFPHDGRHYIFTYHPNWGYRNAGYEDKVINVFKETL